MPFFMFEGRCSDCKTYVHKKCDRDFAVNDSNIQIKISTFNTKNIRHSKKNPEEELFKINYLISLLVNIAKKKHSR